MKKIIAFIVVIGLLIAGVLYIRNWNQFMDQKNALNGEIETYYYKSGSEAARLSVALSRPYLSDEDYGRYSQRLDTLDEYYSRSHSFFSVLDDSYISVMADLGFRQFETWAMRKLASEGKDPNNDASRRELVETTPCETIIAMHQPLQSIGMMQSRFYTDDFDEERLAKTRQDFTLRKADYEAALANAKVKAGRF